MQESHKIHLENFDGALDLLLSLVREKQVDLFEIDLSELASQYLVIIDQLKNDDLDLASEYLVMAATLLQLKTKILLENPNELNDVEEEKQNILKRLVEYQQYKKLAEKLREKEKQRKNIYIKATSNYSQFEREIDETKLDGKSNPVNLIRQMRKMFERVHANQFRKTTIETFNLSPAERRAELIKLFNYEEPTFENIFNVPTINHFVVTLITILDMARKQELMLYQSDQFGHITFKKGVINE